MLVSLSISIHILCATLLFSNSICCCPYTWYTMWADTDTATTTGMYTVYTTRSIVFGTSGHKKRRNMKRLANVYVCVCAFVQSDTTQETRVYTRLGGRDRERVQWFYITNRTTNIVVSCSTEMCSQKHSIGSGCLAPSPIIIFSRFRSSFFNFNFVSLSWTSPTSHKRIDLYIASKWWRDECGEEV